ncbi:hypothetical protein AMEX_G1456 [Astyanax mexicanus]|uniref:Uncharacterized protein n=1 Tax=Astyanax mexicanus TaxID=7994 RepID=A0A8T2MQ15_ASTMX|nr:hypothetical protein AMEX_G1456 [Astyanax mexicanus]
MGQTAKIFGSRNAVGECCETALSTQKGVEGKSLHSLFLLLPTVFSREVSEFQSTSSTQLPASAPTSPAPC